MTRWPLVAGAAVLAVQLAMACTTPALFTFAPPVIVHPPSPPPAPASSGDAGSADATAIDAEPPPTPPARIYGVTQICARLAALTCAEGLSTSCGWQTAPNVDGVCVLSATTVDEVRRCRGVACP